MDDSITFSEGPLDPLPDAPDPVVDAPDPAADAPEGDGALPGVVLDDADGPVDGAPEGEGAGPEGAAAGAKKARGKRARASRSKEPLVLGVHVTPARVYGVLVRPTGEGYEPVRQFVRNRAESQFGGAVGEGALSPDEVTAGEDLAFDALGDDSVQFGGAAEIDFSAEFAGMGVSTDAAYEAASTATEVEAQAQPIVFELRDILEECDGAGLGRPALAFAVDPPDVAYAEVVVPPEKKDKKRGGKKDKKDPAREEPEAADARAPVKRERLVELLPDLGFRPDPERLAFVPMTPRDGLRRYLAVAPTPSEPVAESLSMLREQGAYRKTAVRTLEAEVPLLVGLVRRALAPEPAENTAVVRVGAEDTVVLLLCGAEVHHYELMQSVTAFDGPDTICSRVLLQQDVQGVGTVHHVVVVADEREDELVQGFAAFYPEARVETAREGLAREGLVGPYGPLAPPLVGAAGAAVAGHLRGTKGSPFEEANLLPASLLKRRRGRVDLVLGWHTLLVGVVLFMAALFFSYLYVSQEGEIAAAEQRLAEFPPEARMSAPQLQARIDSLQGRQAALTASLGALDSLLIDTDRWTQTLLRTTRAAAQTGGVWIEEWTPSGHDVALVGYATTRGNVVGLAERLGATIESVSFDEIRGYAVYPYTMRFSQPPTLPQVTRVLRERADDGPPARTDALGAPPADGPAQ
jgi:hypothetical protein